MKAQPNNAVVCDKCGEQMQELTATEISGSAEPPEVKAYTCSKCGAAKMIPGPPFNPK